ncbi:MAG TPA: Calx-beta domain-containing protein [Sedimentisphaerales bacterium]|nr:Calx-beta domain-containing protein [Sedimentisphaerales bacterium]
MKRYKVTYVLAGLILCLCLSNVAGAGAIVLQCDAGEGALQAGWTQVVAGLNANVAGTGIDVTLATGNPAAIAARDTGGTGPLAAVETDLYFANDQMSSPDSDFILTLSNLTPGVGYRLLSYHNRTDEGVTVIPNVTVTGATVLSQPAMIVQDHNIMDLPAEFLFVAGSEPVQIRYQGPDGGCPGCQAFFNGFVLEYGGPTLGFAAAASGGMETISPALVSVKVSNPQAGQTYSVDYAVTGGTATRNVDYSVSDGSLLFPPGVTSQDIGITVYSDAEQEPDETIILTLSNVSGPNVAEGITQHTYTISDGGPKVSFSQASGSTSENTASVAIPVVLSVASDQTVTVNYGVTGGTATGGGVDYTLLGTGTLTFDPLVTTQYVNLTIVDDSAIEPAETIILTLSNPINAALGAVITHTLTIVDNESGLYWNGSVWYYSDNPANLFVNGDGDLEWIPEQGGQYVTRIPEKRLSQVGDKVQMQYWYMSNGKDDCPPDSCYNCIYCDDDITCIAGTSDFRFGLFEADGEYITADGFDTSSSIFAGYKGYNWRFGPHLQAYPTRWVDCTGEVHKTGNFAKKPQSSSNLMTINEGLEDYIPGFELPPGEWSLLTISLERLSSSSVRMLITLNDTTYSWTDASSSEQPTKIDVFGIHMRNGRPYYRLVLGAICEGVGDADFNGDDVVDENDLKVIAQDWLLTGGMGPVPDANYLVVHYNFNETSGSTAYDSSSPAYNGAVQVVSSGAPKTNAWDPGGQDAGCINFDGDTKVSVGSASTAFAGVSSAVTVALWVNGNAAVQPDPGWGMAFQAGKSGNDRVLLAHIPTANNTGVMFESGGYNLQRLSWTGDSPSDWEGQWNHYVFTLDAAAGLARIYCNGDKKAEKTGATTGVDGISSFMVGNGFVGGINYEYFGKVDDFRVYGYALSPDEVLSMYGGGQLPPDSPANLYLDNIIDFKDLAKFAVQWRNACE